METKHNEFTDANLRVFLDDFYMKVRADDLIGPIFITRIGKLSSKVIGFMVKTNIKTQYLYCVTTFFFTASNAHNFTTFQFRDLTHGCAHRPRCCRYYNGITRFWCANI